jgi:hypothetical protein
VLELVPLRPFSADESQAFTQQGQIAGWAIGAHYDAELATAELDMAI